MEIIYNAVKNIILFLILLAIVQNLVGKSSYRQYINIFAGMVLILIVVLPIMDLFHVTDKLNYYFDLNQFKAGSNEMRGVLSSAERQSNVKIMEEYKNQLKGEIEVKLENHKVKAKTITLTLNMDQKSSQFGRVKKLIIYGEQISEKDKENEKKEDKDENTVDQVDKVAIDHIGINDVGEEHKNTSGDEDIKYDTVLELNIKEELAGYLNISMDCIAVQIRS